MKTPEDFFTNETHVIILQIIMYILLIITTIGIGTNIINKKVATGMFVFIWSFFLIGQIIEIHSINKKRLE